MFEEDPNAYFEHEKQFYLDKMEEVKGGFTKRVAKYFGATKELDNMVIMIADSYKEGCDEAERVGDLIGILPEEMYAVFGDEEAFKKEFNQYDPY